MIGAHTIDTTRYLCSSPLSHTLDAKQLNVGYEKETTEVCDRWEVTLLFRALRLTQLDIKGNAVLNEKFSVLFWLSENDYSKVFTTAAAFGVFLSAARDGLDGWGLSGVRRELAEGDQELAGNESGVRQKMTKIRWEFVGGYREDRRELRRSLDTLVKLIVFICLS
ncbi:hypothetical protein BHE74_00041785, partial [Ensete ventricosum]